MKSKIQIVEGIEYKMCFVQCVSRSIPTEKEYAFVLVPIDNLRELQQVIDSKQKYDLTEYGVVVENGLGSPPQAVIDKMQREFFFKL